MDITIVAHNVKTHPNFHAYVERGVLKVTQFYPRVQQVNVELTYERNPRQADTAKRIELTVCDKGPITRAEAKSADRYTMVDIAADKLFEHLRRMRDCARGHRHHYPREPDEVEVIEGVTPVEEMPTPEALAHLRSVEDLEISEAYERQPDDSPIIVHQKVYETAPMTVDEAPDQTKVVGHPFLLFVGKDTKQLCVIYHRHGWTYGILRLNITIE